MTRIYEDVRQGTPEWLALRAGRVTASRASDVLSFLKGGSESAARRDYRLELVTERLTGKPTESGFVSADMQRGTDLEPAARAAYESMTGEVIRQVGFIADETRLVGASPDGLIGNFSALIELKVPRPANHLRWMRAGGLPAEHRAQVTALLHLVPAADYCDFVSYAPDLPEALQLFVVRVERYAVDLDGWHDGLLRFLDEVERDEQALRTMTNPTAQWQASLAARA